MVTSDPVKLPGGLRITVTADRRDEVGAAIRKIEEALDLEVDGRSDIVAVSGGRFGGSVSLRQRPVKAKPAIASRVEAVLTDEQVAVREASAELRPGEDLAVIAGAGTGKTATLAACARIRPSQSILYFAFNADVVRDAKERFPRNVTTGTAHSIARRMVPSVQHRTVGRIDMDELAAVAGIPQRIGGLTRRKMAWLTHHCLTNFADDDALSIDLEHVPADPVVSAENGLGRISEYAEKAWRAICDERLSLPHFAYLKMWQLELARGESKAPRPDLALLDEAQDVNKVIADIAARLDAPLVRVGDPFQSIYSWRGAIDALDAGSGRRLHLTNSFRFGPNIAALANRVLTMHPDFYKSGAKRIVGVATDNPIGTGPTPQVVLCRSNAGVLDEAIASAGRGGARICVVGGLDEIRRLVEDACDLRSRQRPKGREFAAFSSWEELMEEVEAGTAGEVAFIARFVQQRGVGEARFAVARLTEISTSEKEADLIFSTIHKAKGREWGSVRLAGDNRGPDDIGKMYVQAKTAWQKRAAMEEVNLLYVAITRAREAVRLPASLIPLQNEKFRFELPRAG